MRTTPRYYLIADDGQILRLAQKTFYDILLKRRATPFSELRGHRVRLATLDVLIDGKRAIGVARANFNYITFDADGLFDSTEWDKSFEHFVSTWDLPTIDADTKVINARSRFADRQRDIDQTWVPSDELRDRLVAAATGKKPRPTTIN